MRVIVLFAVSLLLLAACQKPAGYRGVEVFEIVEEPLLDCIADNEAYLQEQVVVVRDPAELLNTQNFNLEVNEIGAAISVCSQTYELSEIDFNSETLLLITYQYHDFGGRRDGDYVIRYFAKEPVG